MANFLQEDEKFMRLALEEAAKANPSPNPKVGAVIVKNGQILSVGHHVQAGMPHAEIEAMKNLKPSELQGSTLYVTLEPCSHYGRTPPCTNAIIKNKIVRVVFGAHDVNPKVQGQKVLENSGIEIVGGMLEKEARKMNEFFFFAMENGRPHVTLKWAMSMDGKIATKNGVSKWITGEEARARARQLRFASDAVIAGIGTILADNPSLSGPKYRVVLDSSLRTPSDAKIFNTGGVVIICKQRPDEIKKSALENAGAKILQLKHTTPASVLKALSKEGMNSVFVEGGGETHARFFEAKIYDRLIVYLSPKIVGGKDAKTPVEGEGLKTVPRTPGLQIVSMAKIGNDIEMILEK